MGESMEAWLVDSCVLMGGRWVRGRAKDRGGLLFVYKIHEGHVWVIDYLPPQLDLGYASA